jgi:hypothetical protein
MPTGFHSLARAPALLVVLGVALSACIGGDAQVCPKPLVLDQTGELVRFAPGAPTTVNNLDFQAEIKVTRMECGYTDELLTTMEVNMDLEITAVRGPANTSREAALQYFVAITDVRGTILNKQVFDVDIDLGGIGETVTEEEGIWQKYQMLRGQSGEAYRVWTGFQLNDRDLEVSRLLRTK